MYTSCSIIILKMALLLLSLFVLVQSTRVSSYGLLKNLKACRTYDINHLGGFSAPSFYIDGKLVDKYVFCEILKENLERHCIANKDVENQYCSLDAKLEKLPLREGRLSLETVAEKKSEGNDYDKKVQNGEDRNAKKFLLQPKMLAVAVPAFFLLCCAVLCPCFQARKRDVNHNVLPKEQYSTDSVSSLEMNPVIEKFPGSPMRMSSPMRVPGSPLRVPASPRFSMSPKLSRLGSVHLNMSEVTRATHNFSPSLIIGEGGFGAVYKAELADGQFVAIKRARKEQFESLRTEFKSEVELLAKIDHRNLVKLLGYVEKGNERLLITEFVPNGTLREHLDGLRGKILDFSQRIEISIDVAHGLTYLHLYAEKQIIHRDVKSSNILLTESMKAKVTDFGFARFGDDTEKTHVSTKVKGTMGYLDPEYMRTYQLTSKSDVYSFGIVLLEILTGRRPVDLKKIPDERVTIRWAFRKFNERKFRDMLDPMIKERVDEEILAKLFNLAIQCAAPTRVDRPDMKAVGEQLWEIRRDFLKNQGRN